MLDKDDRALSRRTAGGGEDGDAIGRNRDGLPGRIHQFAAADSQFKLHGVAVDDLDRNCNLLDTGTRRLDRTADFRCAFADGRLQHDFDRFIFLDRRIVNLDQHGGLVAVGKGKWCPDSTEQVLLGDDVDFGLTGQCIGVDSA